MRIRVGFVSNSSTSSFLIIGTSVNAEEFDQLCNEDYDDKGILSYQGYEEGYCIGVDAYRYLEEDKLPDAIQKATSFIKENIPEEIYNGKNFTLIYDACEG